MSHRIEIGLKRGVPDARGHSVVSRANRFLHAGWRSCKTRDVYKLDIKLNDDELARIKKAFADPVIAVAAVGRLAAAEDFDWLVEVGFKPGVTDNLGRTAGELVKDVIDRQLSEGEAVYTAVQYFLRGDNVTRSDAQRIGKELLANTLIQTVAVFSAEEWKNSPIDLSVPGMPGNVQVAIASVNLGGSDDELLRISRDGLLSLSLEEMHAIRDYFALAEVQQQRAELNLPNQPTDLELECIAQTWSEHCHHKIFAAQVVYRDEQGQEQIINSLFKTYIRAATEKIRAQIDWLVSVFTDNAGVIRFNDRVYLSYKVETHNTPSALDPYGGAITGIVGCNRDPMGTGMGSELLCNTWGYCLGSPFYSGALPEGLFHPHRIRDGVHQGVIDGGNQSGIPYARGFERFDDRYIGKPLVYCGTVGLLPPLLQGRPSERKEVLPGDLVVMAGGRIGKDGIHGATFSSEELRQESPAQAVQIGDPITQRMLYEFLIEARNQGLYRAITDNGAGGLSSSVGEMALLAGGVDIDLARAPLKYKGLQPWEIFVSESQERMTLAVQPENIDKLLKLAADRDVEVTALGTFTNNGQLVIRYGREIAGCLSMNFLHDGCPQLKIKAEWQPPVVPPPRQARRGRRDVWLRRLLGSLNICSKEFKSRMYDAEVKGRSVVKPFVGVNCDVPSDATVLLAEYGSHEGVVLAEGINPFYSDIDTYSMVTSVIDEAVRRIICVGGRLDRIAGLDNFCWPDPVLSEKTPDGPYKMAQLVRANQALYDLTTAYGVPCVSGKDSMKNDSVRGGQKISIPPTLLFSAIGKIDDIRRAVTMPWKNPGDLIYVVGRTRNELGASEFYRLLAEEQGNPGNCGGRSPQVDAVLALAIYRAMGVAIDKGLIKSAHTPTLGGLAVAFALCAIGGDLGAQIDLGAIPQDDKLSDDALLFAESNSRFVVTCTPENALALEQTFAGMPCACGGTVTADKQLCLTYKRGTLAVREGVDNLRRSFKKTLYKV